MKDNYDLIRIVEKNGWENETWCFYIPFNKKNWDGVQKLHRISMEKKKGERSILDYPLEVQRFVRRYPSSVTIEKKELTIDQINKFSKMNFSSYMDTHNFYLDAVLDFSRKRIESCKDPDTPLYKGGIKDFFIKGTRFTRDDKGVVKV